MPKMLEADLLCLVTPLYYYGMSAQLKTIIDRFYARTEKLHRKKSVMIATAWNSADWTMEALSVHYKTLVRYMEWEDVGQVWAIGCGYRSAVENSEFGDAAAEKGFPLPKWNEESHLQFMDEAGIDFTVLLMVTPHIFNSSANEKLSCVAARAINEEISSLCRCFPEKFGFVATLPLPSVDGSIREFRYVIHPMSGKIFAARKYRHGQSHGIVRVSSRHNASGLKSFGKRHA